MKIEETVVVPILLVFQEQDRFCAGLYFSHKNGITPGRSARIWSETLDGLRSKIRKDRTRYEGGPRQALETWV